MENQEKLKIFSSQLIVILNRIQNKQIIIQLKTITKK